MQVPIVSNKRRRGTVAEEREPERQMRGELSEDTLGKQPLYISFEFDEPEGRDKTEIAFKKKMLLRKLANASFWIPAGYDKPKYLGTHRLYPSVPDRRNPAEAGRLLNRLGFTVRLEGLVLVASRMAERSLDDIRLLIECSPAPNFVSWTEEWEVLDRIDDWEVVDVVEDDEVDDAVEEDEDEYAVEEDENDYTVEENPWLVENDRVKTSTTNLSHDGGESTK